MGRYKNIKKNHFLLLVGLTWVSLIFPAQPAAQAKKRTPSFQDSGSQTIGATTVQELSEHILNAQNNTELTIPLNKFIELTKQDPKALNELHHLITRANSALQAKIIPILLRRITTADQYKLAINLEAEGIIKSDTWIFSPQLESNVSNEEFLESIKPFLILGSEANRTSKAPGAERAWQIVLDSITQLEPDRKIAIASLIEQNIGVPVEKLGILGPEELRRFLSQAMRRKYEAFRSGTIPEKFKTIHEQGALDSLLYFENTRASAPSITLQLAIENQSERFLLDRGRGSQIEQNNPVVHRTLGRFAQRSFLQARILSDYLPKERSRSFLEEIRQLALDIVELDETYFPVRERIHGSPNPYDLEETKVFLERYKATHANPKLIELTQTLVDRLSDLYNLKQTQENLDIKLAKLARDKKIPVETYTAFSSAKNNYEALDQAATIAMNLRENAQKTIAQVSLEDDSPSNRDRASQVSYIFETLKEIEFYTFSKLSVLLQEYGGDPAKLRSLVGPTIRVIYGLGFIETADKQKTIDAFNLAMAGDNEKVVEFLDSLIRTIEKKLQDTYALPQEYWGQFYPSVAHFTDDLIRSTPILHLGLIRDALHLAHQTVVDSTHIPALKNYDSYSRGAVCGRLKVVNADNITEMSGDIESILVFQKGIPSNAFPHVNMFGAAIAEERMDSLSHIVLRARNRGSPCAFVDGACEVPEIKNNFGKPVKLTIGKDGYIVEPISEDALKVYLKTLGQDKPQALTLGRDISVKELVDLTDPSSQHKISVVGAKASNYSELTSLFHGDETVHDPAFAIPFYFYDQFIKSNGIDLLIANIANDPKIKTDQEYRREKLKEIRDAFGKYTIDDASLNTIMKRLRVFGSDRVRLRSSSNVEDLKGFNGAGLYESYGADANDKKKIEARVRKVWSSLWTDRGFEERDFFGIDHNSTAMGVLIHRSFDNELANGVALSNDPNQPGTMVINAQVGEYNVANPDSVVIETAEEIYLPGGDPSRAIVQQKSSLAKGQPVLETDDLKQLSDALRTIHEHFSQLNNDSSAQFAMDVEFKVVKNKDGSRRVMIKQARPLTAK